MKEERPQIELVYDPSIIEEYRKEQEAKDKRIPKEMELEGGGSSWWYVCPECHGTIDLKDSFCRHCGQAVKE